MALPPADEADTRKRLANVAQFGAAGANMPTEVAPVDPRQGAIDAALARGSQIGAPMQVQDQIGGRIGAVYDAGNQGLGTIRGANGAAVGGINAATSEYERQVALAAPIEEGRNKVAIQQILADRARQQSSQGYDDKATAFKNRQLDFDIKQWDAEHGDNAAPPIDVLASGAKLDLSPSKVQELLSSPTYLPAKTFIGDLKDNKVDYDEFKGAINSLTNPATQIEGVPTIDSTMAAYLIETYGPQFQTPAQRAAAPKGGPNTVYKTGPALPPLGSPEEKKSTAAANHAAAVTAVANLTPKQRATLKILADTQGMSPEEYLMRNPDIMGRKSGKTGKLILAP